MNQDIKELLELAAKACGYGIQDWCNGDSAWAYKIGSELDSSGELPIFKWAPHLDDGDGARMEGELLIQPNWWTDRVAATCYLSAERGGSFLCGPEIALLSDHNGDRQAARRMASLRVAAEVGRRMT